MSRSEIQQRAGFTAIRYAQCWEDSRLLQEALVPRGKSCVSIGSAGDNSFALLAGGAARVVAVEMNPAQVACIELRRAAYLSLEHPEFLELIGSRPSDRRSGLYARCRDEMPPPSREFWDARASLIEAGIGGAGKFERYFSVFRRLVLPLAHSRREVAQLLVSRSPEERAAFYLSVWDNRRWRAIFRVFFSRTVMGALGRDPEFFRYVEGSVADRILDRTRHALEVLDPAANPYLHWILTGTHGGVLPEALERFESIREALRSERFEVFEGSLEGFLDQAENERFAAWNLSDIFEYMSEENTRALLERIADASESGARLVYWNMLAPRSRPESLADRLRPLADEAERLFAGDRAFFYSRFVIEEVLA